MVLKMCLHNVTCWKRHLGNLSEMPFFHGHFHHSSHFVFCVCNTNVFISFISRCYTVVMSKPAESKFYKETLLTLNVNSSDGYVKSIYDDIAEKYDKVPYTFFETLFSLAEVY